MLKRRAFIGAAGLMLAAATLPSAALAQDRKSMVMVVKIDGIPWYNLVEEGLKKAGKDFDMDVSMVGPSSIDPAQQVRLIEDVIARGVDVIGVVPLDVNVLEPVLKRAKEAGITVITQEAPNQPGKDWDVEMVDAESFGRATIDSLAEGMGEEGKYVIYVGTLTTPLHNQWADAAVAYQKERYPDMQLATERFPGGDEIDASYRTTLDVMKAHPDIKGIVAYGSNGAIGAGNAIAQQRAQDDITLVGTSVPSQAEAMIKDGIIKETFLWNPYDTGYAIVSVANLALEGKEFSDGMEVPGLGKATVDLEDRVVAVNKIMVVNKDTIDELLELGI